MKGNRKDMSIWQDIHERAVVVAIRLLVIVVTAIAGAVVDGTLLEGRVGGQAAELLASSSRLSVVKAASLPPLCSLE